MAGALLARRGYKTLILERETFPRFSIGESLLPQCMEYLEEAGMLDAVKAAGFQRKNGAYFQRAGHYSQFDFSEQYTEGWRETFEVQRADFDKILADQAELAGVDIRYRHEIISVALATPMSSVSCRLDDGECVSFSAKFLLDASGFGRVLPRLLQLDQPAGFPVRSSLFTHLEDKLDAAGYDRDKILISVHPQHRDVWYWLIPFKGGRSSIGVLAKPEFLATYPGEATDTLRTIVKEDLELTRLLAGARWDTSTRQITAYSSKAEPLCTSEYVLLGNAAEFLDPVFSSGVTIALRSASKAVELLDRQLRGRAVDWQREFAQPLGKGVDTFRAFVNAWYDGRLQDIIFYQGKSPEIRRMICSILAGYAWDESNPYVKNPEKRLNTLWQYTRQSLKDA